MTTHPHFFKKKHYQISTRRGCSKFSERIILKLQLNSASARRMQGLRS